MKNQNIAGMNINFLTTLRILGFYIAGQLKKPGRQCEGKEFFSDSRRRYCEFGFSVQLQK